MTGRPLIVSDCDEVLLHMVAPFRDWLAERHGIAFDMACGDFGRALRFRQSGELVPPTEIWPLLNGFFDSEMHRQSPVAGAAEAIAELGRHAEVVVLTNLLDFRCEARTRQLADHGIAPNETVAKAANYAMAQAPDVLKKLGFDPDTKEGQEAIVRMIVARLTPTPPISDVNVTVTDATPAAAAIAPSK